MQALSHFRAVVAMSRSQRAQLDVYLYLLQPVIAAFAAAGLIAALVGWDADDVRSVPATLLVAALFAALGFGGTPRKLCVAQDCQADPYQPRHTCRASGAGPELTDLGLTV